MKHNKADKENNIRYNQVDQKSQWIYNEENDPKSSVEYTELCKTVRKCVTQDSRKFNCDLFEKVPENKIFLNQLSEKCVLDKRYFAPVKMVDGTITKVNNEIVSIVKKF